MNTPNPYAPPTAAVQDVADPNAPAERAGRGARLRAALLDGLIFSAFVYLPLMAGGMMSTGSLEFKPADMLGVGAILAAVGLAIWSVVTIRNVKRNGQSIGKKIIGIKVTRSDGSPISLARLFWLRNVVNAIPGAIPLVGPIYGLIDSLLIFGEPRQCLHDKIADTIVVNA